MKAFKNRVFMTIIIAITLAFAFSVVHGQSVVRHGNMFISTDTTVVRGGATKTQYLYVRGENIDTVYLSSKGKAFIWKDSKKTGKKYRKYLPAITEQLNLQQQ